MFINQRTSIFLAIIVLVISLAGIAEASTYRSYVFATYEMIIFSYEDGTELEVKGFGYTLWSGTLNKGEHVLVEKPYGAPAPAVYTIEGSNRFTVLAGDITGGMTGYYALNQSGKGVSTEFYTYVPTKTYPINGSQKVVVFAYYDETEVTIEKDLGNGNYQIVDANVPLDNGENWQSEDLSGQYVHVTANKPVSALSCYDTGYFVPSANGSFGGTRFYTYIGKTRAGSGGDYFPQDLVVTAYDNYTLVTIADCNDPGVIKWQGTLFADEPHVQRFPDGLGEPVSVTSNRPVTVSVQQWVTDEANWVTQGFFVPQRDGTCLGGFGKDILVPVPTYGYLAMIAYMDDTYVKVYNAETDILFKPYSIYTDDPVTDHPGNGLWRIVSDKPISVYTGLQATNGAFSCNAEFSPLLFDVTTGDMVNVDTGASFSGDCILPGDPNYNEICYTLSYWSDPNDDTDVVITDYLPREVEFISADPCNNGLYEPNNHTYTWDIGTVTGGDPNSYCYLTVRVTGYAQPGDEIINKVELSSHTSYSTAEVSTSICCPQNPTIYVKADAQGFRNGSSWADAYTTIQPALTRARADCGSEIWVAGGVYNPSKYITRTPLRLLEDVEMYGGFAGDETSRDQRDFVRNKTYLSGDIDGEGDNDSFGVVYSGWYIEPDSVLDGFVITAGDEWAGLYCDWSWPTIRNCVIRKNSDHGIICDYASPRIYDCRIEENDGSGIYSAAVSEEWFSAGRPIVKRCVIRENHIGLESRDDGRPIITNSWIYYNAKEGISLTDTEESVVIQDNTIVGNGTYGIKSNLQVDLSNCIVWDNDTQLSADCNAIYSCIEGGAAGEGNISDDPCFAYDDPNDYHLSPDSPCIDIGHDPNGDGSYYDNLDIDGNVRVYNGRVDMGADEYTCDDIYNDVDWNMDRIVGTLDLRELAGAWLVDDTDPDWDDIYDKYDLYDDGTIDYADFAVFAKKWLWEPCWTTSGPSAPMMMGMGGGMDGLAGGESMLISATAPVAAAPLKESIAIQAEPSVAEQIEQIKEILDWLYEIKDQIDEETWLGFVTSLEEMLKELEAD